jgi:hypothetical protein
MNERIRELAQNSELAELYDRYFQYCMQSADDDIFDYDKVVGKFAELIVRECANVAAARDALDIYEEIREHFGVKL